VRAAHVLSTVAFVLALALSLTLAGGCIGSQPSPKTAADTDLSLTSIALGIDTGYGTAVLLCDYAEGRALDRAETQEEADAAIGAIRDKCDDAFAAFEVARVAVETATQAATRFTSGEITQSAYLGLLSDAIFAGSKVALVLRNLRADVGAP
jgi:hypothetical protein